MSPAAMRRPAAWLRLPLLALALGWTLLLGAADLDYHLQPLQIAPHSWVFVGGTDDFSPKNGGNIVNTGFILTDAGVVVVDTGPSRAYGEQMLRAIRRITNAPIALVINTHHHPDHFLGNQAFPPELIAALPGTREGISKEGESFNENMFRLVGDWMAGTEVQRPARNLAPGPLPLGKDLLEVLALHGHTGADAALVDPRDGVLFASDLVFFQRAPTTPHARLQDWLASLDTLQARSFRVIVPGHGPVAQGDTREAPIRQTRRWLGWLDQAFRQAAEDGMDMGEVMNLPLPADLAGLGVARAEYQRSVGHLYPAYEQQALSHPRKRP